MSPRDGNRDHPLLRVVQEPTPEPDGMEGIDRLAAEVGRLPSPLTIGQRRLLQVLGRELRRRGRLGRSVKHEAGWLHELYCEMPNRCTC